MPSITRPARRRSSRTTPYERRFRDLHTVIQQVQGQFHNFELVGQVLLGLPPGSKLI